MPLASLPRLSPAAPTPTRLRLHRLPSTTGPPVVVCHRRLLFLLTSCVNFSSLLASSLLFLICSLRMGSMENKSISDMRENILRIFKEFMTGITKIDELGTVGSRLLVGFQQALEYIRRPPIDGTSELIDKIIKANETQRVKMYIEAGCRSPLHGVQNVNKMNSCKLGLLDHISNAKVIVEELEGLLGDVTNSIRRTVGNLLLPISEKDSDDELNNHAIRNDTEGMVLSNPQNVDVTQLAALMSIIYSMVKQDYLMQEKIVSALNLKSSSGELESYCLLWPLRPFINDDIMHQAWRLFS